MLVGAGHSSASGSNARPSDLAVGRGGGPCRSAGGLAIPDDSERAISIDRPAARASAPLA
jgi:hypothetical protein